MIIFKDKNYITNSESPDTDWMGNADYVVPDGSELALKIRSLYPNYDFVLDDSGNLIDVVEIEPVITEEQLNACKGERIKESKVKLAEWLATHPMQFTDGKYYSVTEEKQALLNGNLASYERAKSIGITYDLKWNATEEPCEPWSYTDLLTLSLNIAAYVAPKVSKQQLVEIQIRNCETIEDINAIVIDYDE